MLNETKKFLQEKGTKNLRRHVEFQICLWTYNFAFQKVKLYLTRLYSNDARYVSSTISLPLTVVFAVAFVKALLLRPSSFSSFFWFPDRIRVIDQLVIVLFFTLYKYWNDLYVSNFTERNTWRSRLIGLMSDKMRPKLVYWWLLSNRFARKNILMTNRK